MAKYTMLLPPLISLLKIERFLQSGINATWGQKGSSTQKRVGKPKIWGKLSGMDKGTYGQAAGGMNREGKLNQHWAVFHLSS